MRYPQTHIHSVRRIFVVSGPSGSGKTTLVNAALKSARVHRRVVRSISLTTRPKRCGECDGRDYFFITEDLFKRKRAAKKILEWTRYVGYYYATSKEFVEEQISRGKSVILCLDYRGACGVRKYFPRRTVTIFILPPSLEALRRRIENRCAGTPKREIGQRIAMARKELRNKIKYDYAIINDVFSRAAKELRGILWNELRSTAYMKTSLKR